MKKYLLGFILLSNSYLTAQITFEHSYPFAQSVCQDRLALNDIGGGDYKYIYTCYSSNELRIFNLDHSVYFVVNVPVALINEGEYTIGYVTRSLFDCDSSQFEYAIMPGNPRKNFYVFRQDGTLLFERDSSIAPYTLGAYSGSYDLRPIVNTPSGTKLFLAKVDSNGSIPTVDVYSLCGTLPEMIKDVKSNETFVEVFPIPASSLVHFKFNLPSNYETYELIICGAFNNVISSVIIHTIEGVDINTAEYASGLYYYSLRKNNKILNSGKFIISR
ncbi:MAG: hypothetical protein IPP86_06370 [Bacteroidetes bacterium]|nr:hypothetical protein [Bacteroidota bacterium]